MAKAAKAAKVKAPKVAKAGGQRSLTWLSGLACGVLTAVAPGLAILCLGLLAPALVALWFDREVGRPTARTVLTCGLAGCVKPVITLWNAGQAFQTALALVFDPAILAPAWAAAAAGWLGIQLAPLGVRSGLEAAALTRAARLRAARGRIAEAWDIDLGLETTAKAAGETGEAGG